MDRTSRTIGYLRKWVSDNPDELDSMKAYVYEIADNLDDGTHTLFNMSGVIKKWKRPHGHELFRVFKEAYNKAVADGE